MNEVSTIMEQVLVKGDLRNLSPEERNMYYMKVCESVGINPLTKPFEYIVLNGKMTLYALRTATDQLRAVHKVSVEEMTETERDGVFIVTAKVRNGEGRTDIAKGAVSITGLKGEPLANALMKAETKAKRRATLSICGLGMLDETEVETIPGAVSGEGNPQITKQVYGSQKARNDRFKDIMAEIKACEDNDALKSVWSANRAHIKAIKAGTDGEMLYSQLEDAKDAAKAAIEDKNAITASFGEGFADIDDEIIETPAFLKPAV